MFKALKRPFLLKEKKKYKFGFYYIRGTTYCQHNLPIYFRFKLLVCVNLTSIYLNAGIKEHFAFMIKQAFINGVEAFQTEIFCPGLVGAYLFLPPCGF